MDKENVHQLHPDRESHTYSFPDKLALTTAIIAFIAFSMQIMKYVYWKGFLSFFNVDYRYSTFSGNQGLLEFIFNIIIFVGFALAINSEYEAGIILKSIFHGKQNSFSTRKEKITGIFKEVKKIGFLLITTIAFNASAWYLILPTSIIKYFGIYEWTFVMVVFFLVESSIVIIVELITKKIFQKVHTSEANKKTATITHGKLNQRLNFGIAIIFILCIVIYFFGCNDAKQKRDFFIIENSYAVIYQDESSYWTLFAQEMGEDLVLTSTKQKRIDILGTEIEHRHYSTVCIP